MAVYDDEGRDDNPLAKKEGLYTGSGVDTAEKDGLESAGFYKPENNKKSKKSTSEEKDQFAKEREQLMPSSSKKNAAKKLKGSVKKGGAKKIALAAAGVFGLGGIAIMLVLYLFLGFSVEHLARLQTAYRFGHVHRAIGIVTRQLMVADLTLTPDSLAPRSLPGGRTGLLTKMAGWSPEKALNTLGASEVKFTYDSGSVPGSRKLVSFTDTRTNTVYSSADLGEGRFLNALSNTVDSRVSEAGKGKIFRRRTYNYIRKSSNIRLSRFRAFNAARNSGQNLTPDEINKLGVAEDVVTTRAGRSPPSVTNPEAKAAIDEINQGLEEGKIIKNRRVLKLDQISRLNAISNISDAVFMSTMYCVFRDIITNIDSATTSRIDGFLNHASSLFTSSDMFRAGATTQAALRYEAAKWRGAEKAQEYALALGRSLTTVPEQGIMQAVSYPTKLLGLGLDDWNKVVAAGKAIEKAENYVTFGLGGVLNRFGLDSPIDYACRLVFNPEFQVITAAVETVATIFTVGAAKAAGKLSTQSVKLALKGIVGQAGLGYIMNYLLVKSVEMNTGTELLFAAGEGAQSFNAAGAANVVGASNFASKYTDKIGSEDLGMQQRESINQYKSNERSKGAFYAYLSPNSPFSLTTAFANNTPYSFKSLASTFGGLTSWLFKPANSLNFAFAGVGANEQYDPDDEFYGVQNDLYGFDDDDYYDPVSLINSLEANEGKLLAEYIDKYGVCLTYTATDQALGKVDPSCEDEGAKQLKMYYLYCETIDVVSREGSSDDGYHTRDCFDLAGSYETEFVTSTSPGASSNPSAVSLQGEGLNGFTIACEGEPTRNVVRRSNASADWTGIPDSGTIGLDSDGEPIKVYIREACDTSNPRTIFIAGSIHGSENGGQLVAHELLFKANLPNDVRVIAVPEICTCAGTGNRSGSNNLDSNGTFVDLNRNNDYSWDSLNQTQVIGSRTYSKGDSVASEPETKALNGFLQNIVGRATLSLHYHQNLNYVVAVGTTPTSISRAYAEVVGMRAEGGQQTSTTVTQRGSLDAWYNAATGTNAVLVEMPSGSTLTNSVISNHVEAVIVALEEAS